MDDKRETTEKAIDALLKSIDLHHKAIDTSYKMIEGLRLSLLDPRVRTEKVRVRHTDGGSTFHPWNGACLTMEFDDGSTRRIPYKDLPIELWRGDLRRQYEQTKKRAAARETNKR